MKPTSSVAGWKPFMTTCSRQWDFLRSLPRLPRAGRCSALASGSVLRVSHPFRHQFLRMPREELLLVAKGFDRIEVRGSYGWEHCAYYANHGKNSNGNQKNLGCDNEANVSGIGVLGDRTVERQRPDGEGD